MHIRCASGLKAIVLSSLLAGFVAFPARAEFDPPKPKDVLKAKELLGLCEQEMAQRECLQYIKGVRSGLFAQRLYSYLYSLQKRIDPPSEIKAVLVVPLICVPDSETDEEVRDRVVAQIKKMLPDGLEASAGFSVLLALVENYQCRAPSTLDPSR